MLALGSSNLNKLNYYEVSIAQIFITLELYSQKMDEKVPVSDTGKRIVFIFPSFDEVKFLYKFASLFNAEAISYVISTY